MTSIPTLRPASPSRGDITVSASEPVLHQRETAAYLPTAEARLHRSPRYQEAEELNHGARPEAYYAFVHSLSNRSQGYLELLQEKNFSYQHMTRSSSKDGPRRSSSSGRLTGLEDPPSPAEMAKYKQKKERPFASPYMDRKISHVFPREERFSGNYISPESVLQGPGHYAPAINSQFDGRRATLQSRRPYTVGHPERHRNVGPGTYTPALSGLRYPLGEYDQTMPSSLPRTNRQSFFQASGVGAGEYTPAMPACPRAPGHRSITWSQPDLITAAEKGRLAEVLTGTGPSVGPGAYHPNHSHRYGSTYSATILARPTTNKLNAEVTPGPGAHQVPSHPPTTVPAGAPSRAVSFAARPFLEPTLTAEERAITAEHKRAMHAHTLESLTPSGKKLAKERATQRAQVHSARAKNAIERHAAAIASQDEKARALQAAIEARPTLEERKAQQAEKLTLCRRQSAWIVFLKLSTRHQLMAKALELSREERALDVASRVIARVWHRSPRYTARKVAKEALSQSLIKRGLTQYVQRSRLKAANNATIIIKSFLTEVLEISPMVATLRNMKMRVVRVQRQWRKIYAMREARMAVALRQWDDFEHRKQHKRVSNADAVPNTSLDTKRVSNAGAAPNAPLVTKFSATHAPPPATTAPTGERLKAPANAKRESRDLAPHAAAPSAASEPSSSIRRISSSSSNSVPLAIRRAKVNQWLQERAIEYRRAYSEYYDKLLPKIRQEVEAQIVQNSLFAASALLSSESDTAAVTSVFLSANQTPEDKLQAMVLALAGPAPYFKQKLPEGDLAKMIEEAKEQIRLTTALESQRAPSGESLRSDHSIRR
mmetsp:Transcript_39713/g.104878  ORF Transcript_39713/g.104878 Transcript_39713/m.104878 type:complete len:829 (-) Transcript_39713:97-2583(-)|eukprot:CAMPEP_0115880912 /NCGR_PEP_ID=MMETSP0287-20121206/28135_1 /TAXON_ID=412157 /ORGANISM="Chrysochromulina rotalis, Strain UIO044" /LENGTH=828 /DNA_ID=CAMNT_0003336777 /DNA_START=17 /DNA_END=2503 /DNA_ORIENTATION=-